MKAPILPFFINLYINDTQHLNTEQHGAYLLMLLRMWMNDCRPIKDDEKTLCAITGFTRHKLRKNRDTLARFFVIEDGFWRHKRMEKEWNNVMIKIKTKKTKDKPKKVYDDETLRRLRISREKYLNKS